MKKRFIVLLNSATKEQSEAFGNTIKSLGLGWWHWIENSWLICDNSGKFSASDIRMHANRTHPGVTCLVLEIGENFETWSGFGPNSSPNDMFQWLRDNWQR